MAAAKPARVLSLRAWKGAKSPRFRLSGSGSRPPGDTSKDQSTRRYRPGDTIRQSGIYEVLHDHEHRANHEVVMIGGEMFPDCDTCKDRVRFRLVRTAPYIFLDEDFEEENS